jgi:hypothetical protein
VTGPHLRGVSGSSTRRIHTVPDKAQRRRKVTAGRPLPQPLTTAASGHVRLGAGPADIAALNDIVRDGAQAGNEHPLALAG